ncbi:MAG: GTP-binding protein, partial [Eubacterium sp.]|nr:GTP-binding protein [Eubacterium sp.]
MSLQNTPAAERVHIAFFGVRNAGKSSVVNAVTGQELSIVSDVKGTTTDPVKKTMELLPIGPVVIIDTPGIDDAGELGEERVRRTRRILNQTDLAVLVVSAVTGMQEADRELIGLFKQKEIPFLIALNKTDLLQASEQNAERIPDSVLPVSALTGDGIWELKEALGKLAKTSSAEKPLVRDLVKPGDPV